MRKRVHEMAIALNSALFLISLRKLVSILVKSSCSVAIGTQLLINKKVFVALIVSSVYLARVSVSPGRVLVIE